MSQYYCQFLAVGGMPEAVQTFVNNPDFRTVEKVHRSILTTYRADISQYAGKDQVLVKRVFDAIPSELAKEDKRFVLADLEKGASRRKYEDPTQWLIDAGIAYYSFNRFQGSFFLPQRVSVFARRGHHRLPSGGKLARPFHLLPKA